MQSFDYTTEIRLSYPWSNVKEYFNQSRKGGRKLNQHNDKKGTQLN